MQEVYALLLSIGLVCFAFAAFEKNPKQINLIGAGLFCWILVSTLQTYKQIF